MTEAFEQVKRMPGVTELPGGVLGFSSPEGNKWLVVGPEYDPTSIEERTFSDSLKEAQARYWLMVIEREQALYIHSLRQLNDLQPMVFAKKEEFHQANAELFISLEECKANVAESEQLLKTADVELFKMGIIGRSQFTSVVEKKAPISYNPEKALEWARINMPVAIKEVLDTKVFESYAGVGKLEFVTVQDKIPTAQIARKKVEEVLSPKTDAAKN